LSDLGSIRSSVAAGRRPRLRPASLAAALLFALLGLLGAIPAGASAAIHAATTIDGPGQDIVSFGGVAMAEDGTGGLVYVKRSDGVPHVFVSRYVNGAWQAPIQVDRAQAYAGGSPVIGAANGGELLVAWDTPVASANGRPIEELLGSVLERGSELFGPARIIDPNIGSGNGADPDLAMSSSGQADIVYRVVDETGTSSIPLLRSGDVVAEIRLAHFEGQTWSRLGAINRDRSISMRPPTPANAPKVAIAATGNAIVVWQEPESNGVARIWARRIFGRTLDYVLPVSAATYNGAAISDDADAPSVAMTRFGAGFVAYRQGVGPGSPLPGPRIFLDTIGEGEATEGSEFTGAVIADSAVAGGAGASIGAPSIDSDEDGDTSLLYDADGTARLITNDVGGTSGSSSLAGPVDAAETTCASVVEPTGGNLSAWSSADAGGPGVDVRQEFTDGATQTALLRGGNGGPVTGLAVARAGTGDALLAFLQGPIGNAAIVAGSATAPPTKFFLKLKAGWVSPAGATISWTPAVSATGGLRYVVLLDGRQLSVRAGAQQLKLDPRGLRSGAHHIQVLALDAEGQTAVTQVGVLDVDGQPPVVSTRTHAGRQTVRVTVHDSLSGVRGAATRVSYGDGTRAARGSSFVHRYAHAGLYTIVVHVEDRVGNRATVRRLVYVP
jgi:hypothetical protein